MRSVGRIASEKVCDLRLRRQRCMCHGWSHRCWAGHALRCYHRGLIPRIALFGSNFLDRPVPISEVQKVRNHFHSNVWLQPFVCLHNQCANRPCLRHSLLTMVIATCSVHPGGMHPSMQLKAHFLHAEGSAPTSPAAAESSVGAIVLLSFRTADSKNRKATGGPKSWNRPFLSDYESLRRLFRKAPRGTTSCNR